MPGSGAADPRFNRIAAEEEAREDTARALDTARGLNNRGADYALVLRAEQLAGAARSAEELAERIRREFNYSHSIQNERQAETLARVAFTNFARAQRVSDSDFAWTWTAALHEEYKQQQLKKRRERVGDIARAAESDPIFRDRLEWYDQINQLAEESGLEPGFVEAFLTEYLKLTRPRFPGTIDPRGIPFIQASATASGVAYLIKDYITPVAIYEGVTGKDILTGKELEWWERGLLLATSLMPVAEKALARPLTAAVRAGIRPIAIAIRYTGQGARKLAAVAVEATVSARGMLRALGRLAKIPLRKARSLLIESRTQRRAAKLCASPMRTVASCANSTRRFGSFRRPARGLRRSWRS
jgi:hypothetical protein